MWLLSLKLRGKEKKKQPKNKSRKENSIVENSKVGCPRTKNDMLGDDKTPIDILESDF